MELDNLIFYSSLFEDVTVVALYLSIHLSIYRIYLPIFNLIPNSAGQQPSQACRVWTGVVVLFLFRPPMPRFLPPKVYRFLL